jgi:hypothetical protein
MTFIQLHERLRQEMLRRVQRGTLSVSLLGRQTGMAQAHMSNFLRARRQLSLDAADRVMTAHRLTVADLLPAPSGAALISPEQESAVPVVSHSAALFEPYIKPSGGQQSIHPPGGLLGSLRAKVSSPRRAWQRFVAVRVKPADAEAMEPVLLPEAIVVLDRHYISLATYQPNRPNLYALRNQSQLTIRYVEYLASQLVLRPHNIAFPVELIELEPDESPSDLISGRVVLIVNEA